MRFSTNPGGLVGNQTVPSIDFFSSYGSLFVKVRPVSITPYAKVVVKVPLM